MARYPSHCFHFFFSIYRNQAKRTALRHSNCVFFLSFPSTIRMRMLAPHKDSYVKSGHSRNFVSRDLGGLTQLSFGFGFYSDASICFPIFCRILAKLIYCFIFDTAYTDAKRYIKVWGLLKMPRNQTSFTAILGRFEPIFSNYNKKQ